MANEMLLLCICLRMLCVNVGGCSCCALDVRVPGDVLNNVPDNVPGHVPGDVPGDVPDDVPGDVLNDMPDNVPGDVPTARHMPQRGVCQTTPRLFWTGGI